MSKSPVRVLRIVAVLNRGGIESQIMNMYREIDKEKYQFDFLVTRNEKGIFEDEIISMGGRIHHIPGVKEVGLFKFIKHIHNFFKENKQYKIVHCHMNTWSGLILNVAKLNKIQVRIAHSHSANQNKKESSFLSTSEMLFKNIMKRGILKGATHLFAVGKASAAWLYGEQNEVTILPNAKNIQTFEFDQKHRAFLRHEFGIADDDVMIGQVGSFSHVKNHEFSVELMNKLILKKKNVKLFLIGSGVLEEKIKSKVNEFGLQDNIIFLGDRNDVNKIMSALDILILPSFFEGMPNVIIEAQIASLLSLVSNTVSSEIDFGVNKVIFEELNVDKWVSIIEKQIGMREIIDLNTIRQKGYDLKEQVMWHENFYARVLENLET
ncbi:glycosyltransferase [Exiguobacterium sp. s129]|uniref:glycosyltransferase n=1 Tax=Exiguobacterium sp. s129 TaxID=2751264 RepID=UPI001BE86712|nr:glycosyltransferase [Exiguobacterium sp. s129]